MENEAYFNFPSAYGGHNYSKLSCLKTVVMHFGAVAIPPEIILAVSVKNQGILSFTDTFRPTSSLLPHNLNTNANVP